MDVTNLSSTPVGPPPTTTCSARGVMKNENMMVKVYQPCVIIDQPLRDVVQGTQQSPRLEGNVRKKDVEIELKLPTIHKLPL